MKNRNLLVLSIFLLTCWGGRGWDGERGLAKAYSRYFFGFDKRSGFDRARYHDWIHGFRANNWDDNGANQYQKVLIDRNGAEFYFIDTNRFLPIFLPTYGPFSLFQGSRED